MKDFKFKLMLRKVVLLVNCLVYLGFNRSSLSAVKKRPERTWKPSALPSFKSLKNCEDIKINVMVFYIFCNISETCLLK